MDTNILQSAQAILMTVISIAGGYGTYAIKKGFDYLKTKTSIINDSEARNVANNALSILDNLLETNITYAENVLKQPIIDMIADGKVTKDELKSLSNIVKTNVLTQMTDDTKTALGKIVTDVENFVEIRLEATLGNLKINDTSSVQKTTVEAPSQPVIDTTELENQLQQANADKDSLSQQVTDLKVNLDNINQTNNNLSIQNQGLQQQIQDLTNKLNTITQVVTPVVANNVQTQADANVTNVTQ